MWVFALSWADFYVRWKTEIQFHSSTYKYPVLLALLTKKTSLSPKYVFGTFVKNQLVVCVWMIFCTRCSESTMLFSFLQLSDFDIRRFDASSFMYSFVLFRITLATIGLCGSI